MVQNEMHKAREEEQRQCHDQGVWVVSMQRNQLNPYAATLVIAQPAVKVTWSS